nr:recombinase family protein [Micrococcus cohnii]
MRTLTDLDERGIGVEALDLDLDTTTAAGRLVVRVMASLAEWERDLLIERTREGLEAARRQGRVGGRPRALDEKDQAAIKASLEAGLSVADVARMHGASTRTISRVKSGTY